MKRYLLLTLSVLLTLPYSSFSQEYSYTHYDVNDGLAGSTAYCLTQDKEGFIWVGTETGVSRFDGTHFVNFTSADGLPDTEVLQMFCDSKGRVWMAPFRSAVCYYYKGKIYNQNNDTILRGVHSTGGIEGFAEDSDGNILIQEQTVLHLITTGNKLVDYTTIDGRPVHRFFAISAGLDHSFLVMADNSLYTLTNGRFVSLLPVPFDVTLTSLVVALNKSMVLWRGKTSELSIAHLSTKKIIQRPFESKHYNHISFAVAGDSLAYDCRASGVLEFNTFTGVEHTYLPGVQVSRLFRDNEGDMWFATLGKGIYRLNSNEIRNLTLRDVHRQACAVVSINRSDGELLIGADHDMVFHYPLPEGQVTKEKVYRSEYSFYSYVTMLPNGYMLSGSFDHILLTRRGQSRYGVLNLQVKMAVRTAPWELIIGNAHGIFTFDLERFSIKDTLWRQRPTALYLREDTLYIGSLKGLYRRTPDGAISFLGDSVPFLRRRISAVTGSEDGGLWVASYDAGLIKWRNGRQELGLTTREGLTSDICRTVLEHGRDLWVGTDKGLNKVDLAARGLPVTHFTARDGLASDMINTTCIDGNTIFIGTPEGLSYFNTAHMILSGHCGLVLLNVSNSGKSRLADTLSLRLGHRQNNIRFDFAGISYRSAGNMTYRYRLMGLDSAWSNTNVSFLEYPTLPSGDYALQLQAINKFNEPSRMMTLRFSVDTPFWATTWFYGLMILLLIACTWLFISLRIKHLRRRQAQERELHKRLAETEHMALQAQMNPHFIFNCLNSIQQYIFDQDIQKANKYITGFAKLIRATLHNSSKPFITLAEEVDYLSAYLSLEKLRFKEKMHYTFQLSPKLDRSMEDIFIPPMLIQPYIENSIRHGLRHKTEGGGCIRINIGQEEDWLTFIIEDNGIGREAAARYKTREHIEYQSKGMSLTADRIRLINTAHRDGIRVEVCDLKDHLGQPSGTRVTIWFPGYDLAFQKDGI